LRLPLPFPSSETTSWIRQEWQALTFGIIHPYAVVTEQAGLLVSGRALRMEHYLHLADQQARQAKAAGWAPKPGQRDSRRWRRYRARLREAEARHRRRVHQAQHQAAGQVVAFVVQQRVGTLVASNVNLIPPVIRL
jgi:hypothetical protein